MATLQNDQEDGIGETHAYGTRSNSTRASIWILLGLAALTWSAIWAVGRGLGHLILG